MRALLERLDLLLALVVEPGLDELRREDVALQQEVVVGLECVEGLLERSGELRDCLGLLGRKLVEVLVDGLVRLDAVLDAVEAGHQLGGEGEVRVARAIRNAELDALGLRVRARDGDADAGGAVAGRVDQVHGSLETGHQATEGVDAGVREREHGRGVLEQATDVPAGDVGESAVAGLVVEQRLAVGPEGLVRVHAGAVVAEERLRHEGGRLAPLVGGVLDDVLELQDVVGRVHHGVEAVVDLALAGGADLVVAALEDQAGVDQLEADVVAEVGVLVDRADGEVATLVRRGVAEVAALEFQAPSLESTE